MKVFNNVPPFLSMGVPMAEIARQVGVCASAVAKAIQAIEAGGEK